MVNLESVHNFLEGGGDMGKLIRARDWNKTPLGNPNTWPTSLRIAVRIMLDTPFGMYIAWGKEYIQLYNDGYRPILGATKHPQALGISTRQTFAEIWPTIGPMFEGVMEGTPVGFPDFILHLDRNGFVEECFFDFSYSPIRLEDGKVGGVLVTVIETTEKVKAVKALKDSEQQLLHAIETAELGTWDLNPVTNKFRANSRLKEWFGLHPDEEIELSLALAVIAEKDRDQVISAIENAMQFSSGGHYDINYTIIHPQTNNERIVRAKGMASFNDAGIVYRFNGTLQDVTKEIVAHQLLTESEQLLSKERLVLYNSFMDAPAAIAILKGDTHIYEFANTEYEKLVGRKITNGKTVQELFPELDQQGLIDIINNVFTTGEAFSANEFPIEILNKKTGKLVLGYYNVALQPLKDEKGNTERLMSHSVEVTKQVEARKQIEESESSIRQMASHLKLATDSANLGTWSFDVISEKLEWSGLHNKMWGYDEDREEIAYEDWYKLIDASDKEKVFRLIEEAKINHTVYDVNYCIHRANDGALRCIRSIGKYYYNDHGEAETLTGISIDISDEKEIDETLRYRKALLEAHNEANRDGLLLVDAKGKIISFNKSFIDIWRMNKKIVDAKDDDLALAFAMKQLVNPQQFVDKVKWMYEHPSETCKDELEFLDGRIIERHGYSVWGDDGTYYAWSWTFRDITEQKAAAKALKESEERVSKERTVLYNSFMNAPAGIAIYKGDTHIYEFANVEHEKIARRKITIGKTVQALFPELEQQGLLAMLANVYKTGEPFVADEFPIELSNEGNDELVLGYYSLVVQPLIDEKGKIDRILSHAVEVTHQVEARKLIEESQQRFSMLADNIPNLTWMAYADGNIFWYNKKWFEYTGTTLADMEGWGWQSVHDPEVLPQVRTGWKASIETGQPFEMVFPIKGADGKFRKFLTRVLPVLDSQNKIYRWFGTNTDISKQIEAEDKIKESEAKFRMLSENIPHMVWTATPDGQKNFFNKYFIDYTGFSFEELKGDGWHKIIFPDDLEKELEQWHHHLKTGEDFTIEKRVRHHNGNYRWHISHGIALKDEDGKIIGWIGTNTDITEQKSFSEALEENVKERTQELYEKNLQLEQTNAELISFSYISSHDLQEPLRKIQMFSSRILETESDILSENAMNYIERMQRSAHRMQKLIQDLIAYSRVNVQETKFESTDLNDIIEDVKETLSEELEHKDVTFKLKNICDIKIIPIQFTQVILNLVSNSIKFAKADQPLVIEIECEEVKGKKTGIQSLADNKDYIHIRVSDNGIGFEPQYNERIFEVFQRLHGREEFTGTGIGLAIVKRIIDNHDGLIRATGKFNEGATFDMYIPT